MCVAIVSLLARRCLHLDGFSRNVYLVVVSIVVILVGFGVQVIFVNLRARAESSVVFSLIFVAVTLVIALFGRLVLQQRNRSIRNKHTTNGNKSLETARRIHLPMRFASEGSAGSASVGEAVARQDEASESRTRIQLRRRVC